MYVKEYHAQCLRRVQDTQTQMQGNIGAKRRPKRTCLYVTVDCPTVVLAVEFR